jgi:transmembrane sensor
VSAPVMIEAAEWAERLDRDPSAVMRARFEDWHARPDHAAAWAVIAQARAATTALADHPDLLALRHAAVARAALRREPRRVAPWILAAAACATVVAPLALWRFADDTPAVRVAETPVYRTATGQRLMVTLSDGSRLTLDTDTRVRMAYTRTERRLVLERGQALFEVAKHQTRPFVVTAGAQAVTAHGTAFDVRLETSAVRVALLEGLVSVAGKGARGKTVAMVPDDVLIASASGVSVRHMPGSAQRLASWSEGRLVFEDETLRQAVAEINRYSVQQIAIADPAAGRVRISGAFRTGDVQPFLDALELGFPVSVDRHPNGSITIASKK